MSKTKNKMSRQIPTGIDQTFQKISRFVQVSDLYNIMYMKPFQCQLDQTKGGLPKGLRIIQRGENENQYQQKAIQKILSFKHFYQRKQQLNRKIKEDNKNKVYGEDLEKLLYKNYIDYCRKINGDNMLCQMKTHGDMQMAICICMYNEDRSMLNNTLAGVGENIINLYKQGVDPDKIAVIVIIDGIQKMNDEIPQLMKVLQAQSGMRYRMDKDRQMDQQLQKIDRIQYMRSQYGWQGEDNVINLNTFLFSKEEQQKREKLRFINVKKQYDQVKKLLKEVNELMKKKNITHQDLPQRVLYYFKIQCKISVTGQNQDDKKQNNTPQSLDKYYRAVCDDLSRSKPLVQNALTKAKSYCHQYIQSRAKSSHVSFFRTGQYFPSESGYSSQDITELSTLKSRSKTKIQSEEHMKLMQGTVMTLEDIDQITSIKMNIFFVVKYANNQKLSSHNWFFNGFCKEFSDFQAIKSSDKNYASKGRGYQRSGLSPKYSILLDVGLRPDPIALCKMFNAMVNQNDIGGVCGYMGLKLQRSDPGQAQLRQNLDFFSNLCLNVVDIQRAQQLEYHFAHLIDKGFQSIFKFIHVLPGAFSGYNMNAIWGSNPQKSDQLLENYFKSISDKVKNQKHTPIQLSFVKILLRIILPDNIAKCIDPVSKDSYEHLMYESNVYLAEDRILCMGIHKNNYNLIFLPDAYSYVDPVKDIPGLMGQRKRWINGSFFAFEKVSEEFRDMSCCQVLNIQLWYLAFMNMLAFIAPGFFLFSISVTMQVVKADVLSRFFSQPPSGVDSQILNAFVYTINFIYAMLIFGLIYYSINLTNKNQKFVRFIYSVSTILGTMSLIMLVILVVDLARGLSRSGSSYLISNGSFVENIPGGQSTVDTIRYIVLGIFGLYAVPLLLYSLIFCNFRVITQVLAGAVSFAFYTPTYLIILNIYALCRMDDLSWGTKGLQASSGSKDEAVLNTWKIIRTIHVGKLVFWNVIVAGLLIHFGSNYLIRFWLTLALMIIIASTMALKVLFAIVYYLYYRVCINTKPIKKDNGRGSNTTIQTTQGEMNKFDNNRSARYLQTSRQLINVPSLYTYFKSSIQVNGEAKTLKQQLKEDIKNNIEILYQQTGANMNEQVDLRTLQMISYMIRPGQANGAKGKKNNYLASGVFGMMSSMQKKSVNNKMLNQSKMIQKNNKASKKKQQKQQESSHTSQSPLKSQMQNNSMHQQNKGLLGPLKDLLRGNKSPQTIELPPIKPTEQRNQASKKSPSKYADTRLNIKKK